MPVMYRHAEWLSCRLDTAFEHCLLDLVTHIVASLVLILGAMTEQQSRPACLPDTHHAVARCVSNHNRTQVPWAS